MTQMDEARSNMVQGKMVQEISMCAWTFANF